MKNILLKILSALQSIILKFHFSSVCNHGFLFNSRFNGYKKKNTAISIGTHTHLNHTQFELSPDTEIVIGDHCRLYNVKFHCCCQNLKIEIGSQCLLNDVTIWAEDKDNTVLIREGTYIGGAHIAVTGRGKSVAVGSHCMFSEGIIIRTGDSHAIINLETGEKINDEKNVMIGSHVWLAQNVTVLKGTIIEENCVVATGAIVSGHFSKCQLIGGMPAKVLKQGISWTCDRYSSQS